MINHQYLIIIIALIIISCLFYYKYYRSNEQFDTTAFYGQNAPLYGLRGEIIKQVPVGDYYIRPDRHIRLSETGGFMWQSNLSPYDEGNHDCRKVKCPTYDDQQVYDNIDNCWKCSKNCL